MLLPPSTGTMKKFLVALFFCMSSLSATAALAQDARIDHMEPPFWWTGMQHKTVQLLVHGRRLADLAPALAYPGVRIARVTRVANPNYLFVDLQIGADAAPGQIDIIFSGADQQVHYPYRLMARAPGSAGRTGYSSKDVIYQVMPDRFANGNPANDSVKEMADKADRASGSARHGGDIQGIIDRLGYIAGMGFTQLWPTPLVENDMPAFSYHGYAATNHYKIDPRYGSNEDYLRLSSEARKHGIGIIQDVVLSHIGSGHWWMKDMPAPDWTNHEGKYVGTQHHRVAVQDPYGSRQDLENFTTGWFSPNMPDLNQDNPLVANYLIQNNIWWVEYAGLSGLRIDTYGYSGKAFLAEFTRRLMSEYPDLNMVGEEWSKLPAVVSHWQRGKRNFDGYASSLPGLMDFPLAEAMRTALADKSAGSGFTDVYEMLAQDHLYPAPRDLVLFEGNHDMARMFSVVGEELGLYKIDLAFIMTMPRIPQFYYGTEVLMTSTVGTRDDASYRHDFPGGWAGDKIDAVSGAGLSAQQKQAQAWVRKLVNWRKSEPLIHSGKLMHYGPEHGTYVYFRYDGARKVMVALNKNPASTVLPVARFHEMLRGVKSGVDVITGATIPLEATLTLPPRSATILELR